MTTTVRPITPFEITACRESVRSKTGQLMSVKEAEEAITEARRAEARIGELRRSAPVGSVPQVTRDTAQAAEAYRENLEKRNERLELQEKLEKLAGRGVRW